MSHNWSDRTAGCATFAVRIGIVLVLGTMMNATFTTNTSNNTTVSPSNPLKKPFDRKSMLAICRSTSNPEMLQKQTTVDLLCMALELLNKGDEAIKTPSDLVDDVADAMDHSE
jgi:hypothetical protein